MLEAVIALVGTVIGAALGFGLSEWGQSRREKREEERQAKSARALVSLELDGNLQQLKEFWREANQLDERSKDEDQTRIRLARRVIELPFPNLHREAYGSQLSRLPVALSEDLLFRTVWVYHFMARLEVVRNALETAAREQEREWESARQSADTVCGRFAFLLTRRFERDAPVLLDEMTRIMERLTAEGNPLHSQD